MSHRVPGRALAVAVALPCVAACGRTMHNTAYTAHTASGRIARGACVEYRDSLPQEKAAVVYLAEEVDSAVALYRQRPPARSPHADGEVWVRFVVLPDGRIDWETYKMLSASDPKLEPYAEAVLEGSAYTPAVVGGQPVRQCVTTPIAFTSDR
jgi:Gram-negative bacterial TonB protein C-terminal